MSYYSEFSFTVEAVHPSGMVSYESGKATAQRKFKVECIYAEEFALRMMGKYLTSDDSFNGIIPRLPAPFPFTDNSTLGYGNFSLVAESFTIEPISTKCFQVSYEDESAEGRLTEITDPTSLVQMEKYFGQYEGDDSTCCECYVYIKYAESPCDCLTFDNETGVWEVHDEILPNTCIGVERNPAYEMFTLPNTQLIWADMPGTTEEEQAARRLKADSYAFMVIPKADIIVHWHNVPVSHLCAIETHLALYRGKVNDLAWGDSLNCDATLVSQNSCGCNQFEAETILFVDWQEDRARRTDCFYGFQNNESNRNTTTLKLFFKQKRIEKSSTASYSDSDICPDENDIVYGWNHLFLDREYGVDEWMRVAVEGTEEPLFKLKSFSDIFYPEL